MAITIQFIFMDMILSSSKQVYYNHIFPLERQQRYNLFHPYGIFRCLELSLLKVMFTCLLSETFGTFWKKAGEFEFRI